jgi:hypothetical protein
MSNDYPIFHILVLVFLACQVLFLAYSIYGVYRRDKQGGDREGYASTSFFEWHAGFASLGIVITYASIAWFKY